MRDFRKILILILCVAGCRKSELPQDSVPGLSFPLCFNMVGVDRIASRSLVEEVDNADVDNDGIPDNSSRDNLAWMCSPSGGNKAIGIWADLEHTVNGVTTVQKNIFKGMALQYYAKSGGHEDNPSAPETDSRSKWNYKGDELYWSVGGVYKFRAFYPSSDIEGNVQNNASATTFAVEYSVDKLQQDLLMAYTMIDTYKFGLSNHVPLYLKHMLSAVKFKFRYKPDFIAEDRFVSCWLENITEADHGVDAVSVVANLAYGTDPTDVSKDMITWTPSYFPTRGKRMFYWENDPIAAGDSYLMKRTSSDDADATTVTAYRNVGLKDPANIYAGNDGWILMIPGTSLGNTHLVYTTQKGGDILHYVKLPKTINWTRTLSDGSVETGTSERLEPGKRYVFTVLISKTDLEIVVSIEDWNIRDSSFSIHL